VAEAHGPAVARATAELHVALSEIDVEAGDLENARRHLGSRRRGAAMNESRHRWFAASALLAQADGDPQEAVQLLDQAEQLYRPGFFPDVRRIGAVRARTWIGQGELAEADHWARQRGLAASDEARYLSEFDHLTLMRLLLARHQADQTSDALDQVVNLLDRLGTAADTDRRAGSQLEIRLLQALVQDAQGRRPQALTTSPRGWSWHPSQASHLRLFSDEGAPLIELLADAGSDGVLGDLTRQLLPVSAGTRARRPTSGHQAAPPGSSLSDRELEVLRLLDSELTGPQIARRLFVTHNTVRTHTKRIFTKLDVSSRHAAVLLGREHGLI
jgi:LuxR family maltose regulon positive regulatory protein